MNTIEIIKKDAELRERVLEMLRGDYEFDAEVYAEFLRFLNQKWIPEVT